MANIEPGQTIFDQVSEAIKAGQPFYKLPEDSSFPLTARAAMTEAGNDFFQYQFERMRFDVAVEWVKGEISEHKFLFDWNNVTNAIKIYRRSGEIDPRYQS
jgi:hypothetical protein